MNNHQWVFRNGKHILFCESTISIFTKPITKTVLRAGTVKYNKYSDEWMFYPEFAHSYEQDTLEVITRKLYELNNKEKLFDLSEE